jgi:hypothetical protein
MNSVMFVIFSLQIYVQTIAIESEQTYYMFNNALPTTLSSSADFSSEIKLLTNN